MCIMFWKKKKVASKPVVKIVPYQKPIDDNAYMNSYVVEPIKPELVKNEKKEKIQKYHVSQNKDKDAKAYMMWRVRKEGSDKTIQYFDTQKLAIDYAQDLANRAGSTVVIHKLDGSIRKQDYTNKA